MDLTRARLVLGVMCLTLVPVSTASAQVFGNFAWQMQPYCNVVSLTLTNTPAGFTLDGTDDQCGAPNKASAVGMATFNGGGLVNVNFTIVTSPSGKAVHVAAVVSPATGSGTWTDSVGNSGNFALGSPGSGSPRPLPTSGIGPATITTVEIATAAVGAAQIAADAVGAAQIAAAAVGASEIAAGAVRASHLGAITQRNTVSAPIPPGGDGFSQANCLAGEQVLTGGNSSDGSYDMVLVTSRRAGNGWIVFARNNSASAHALTAHVYCLAQ